MGDALATFIEARCARENPNGESSVRVRPTYCYSDVIECRLAAAAIAEACTKTILAEGLKAIEISFNPMKLANFIRML